MSATHSPVTVRYDWTLADVPDLYQAANPAEFRRSSLTIRPVQLVITGGGRRAGTRTLHVYVEGLQVIRKTGMTGQHRRGIAWEVTSGPLPADLPEWLHEFVGYARAAESERQPLAEVTERLGMAW